MSSDGLRTFLAGVRRLLEMFGGYHEIRMGHIASAGAERSWTGIPEQDEVTVTVQEVCLRGLAKISTLGKARRL